MNNPFASFFGRRPKGKRTIVTTTTERRTPDGILISSSESKNIFYGDSYSSITNDRVATSPKQERRQEEIQYRSLTPIETTRERHEYRSSTPLQRTREMYEERISSPIPRPRETYHNERIVPISRRSFRNDTGVMNRTTEYIDPAELCGNSTIYGDDWSMKESICKNSYLVRQSEGLSTELLLVMNRLNDLRTSRRLRPLVIDCSLMKECDRWIRIICSSGEIRYDVNRKMTLWKGQRLHSAIADLWTRGIDRNTQEEINIPNGERFDPTKDGSLSVLGLSSGYSHRENLFVVVAIFD